MTFCLFADDTNIYYESSNTFDPQEKMNIELKQVKKWLDANRQKKTGKQKTEKTEY